MEKQIQNFSNFKQLPIILFFAFQPIVIGLAASNGRINSRFLALYLALATIIGLLLFFKSIGNDFRMRLVAVTNWTTFSMFLTIVFLKFNSENSALIFLLPMVIILGIAGVYVLQRQFNALQIVLLLLAVCNIVIINDSNANLLFIVDLLLTIALAIKKYSRTKQMRCGLVGVLVIALIPLFNTNLSHFGINQLNLPDLLMLISYLAILGIGFYWIKALRLVTSFDYCVLVLGLTLNLVIIQLAPAYSGYLNLVNFVLGLFVTWNVLLCESTIKKAGSPDQDKVSILMPTYNSADTIEASLASIIEQKYSNFEVIVIDDGSTDDTQKVVQNFQNKNKEFVIKYLYQKNADQLSALQNGLQFTTGEVFYILHSDDLFWNADVLATGVASVNHLGVDGVFVDFESVDKDLKRLKINRVKPFKGGNWTLIKTGLLFGRNPYVDFAFWRRDAFVNQVRQNYLENNMVAWYDFDKQVPLNMVNLNSIGFKYRIHGGNYLNSADGAVNVLSGELRILLHILANHRIPAFNVQSMVFRAFNKFKLDSLIPVINLKGSTEPTMIIERVMRLRVAEINHPYLMTILNFFKNRDGNKQERLVLPEEIHIYTGGEIRLFNRALGNNELPDFYQFFMKLLAGGTTKIIAEDEASAQKIRNLLEFFCVRDYVEVEVTK